MFQIINFIDIFYAPFNINISSYSKTNIFMYELEHYKTRL